jgi:hypothetical protein
MERLHFAALVAMRIVQDKPVKQIALCRERAAAVLVQRVAAAPIQKLQIVKVHLEAGKNLCQGVGICIENTR